MKKIFLLILLLSALVRPLGAAEIPPSAPSLPELEAKYQAAQAQIEKELANLRAAQSEIARIREAGPRLEAEAQALKAQIDALKKNPGPAKN